MNSLSEIGTIFFGSSTPAAAPVKNDGAARIAKADDERSQITPEQRAALRELGRRGGRKRSANLKAYKENTPAAALAKSDDEKAK